MPFANTRINLAAGLVAVVMLSPGMAQNEKPGFLSRLEAKVVVELNLARQQPKHYAEILEARRPYFRSRTYQPPGQIPLITREGWQAVAEAIRFLRRVKPMPPLVASRGLSRAARDHVNDHGPRGKMGHKGSDGSQPWERMNRYGSWSGNAAENISYGAARAREIVVSLIVDDGVPNRGHRKNIFNPAFRLVGVAIGTHKTYGNMCVIDFAAGFDEQQ